MKIGISGSAGVGKTVLAREMAKVLQLPLVEEGVREWMKEYEIDSLRGMDSTTSQMMQQDLLDKKIESETTLPGFVADRTTIDNMVYALHWLSREEKFEKWLTMYLARCLNHAAMTYDMIIVLPWGAIPYELDGVRSSHTLYQLEIQMVIEGFIANHPEILQKTVRLPGGTIGERMEYAMAMVIEMTEPDQKNFDKGLK